MRTFQQWLAVSLCFAAMASANPAMADEADTLFAQGLAAYKEGKLEDALRSYESAWKQRKTHDLAAAMAQVEMMLNKPREAAEHLSYALRHFPVSGKQELRDKLESALAEAKTKVTLVRLTIAGGAEAPSIKVDGQPVDTATTGMELWVMPGTRTIEASAKGYPSVRQKLEAKAGTAVDVRMTLLPEEQPSSPSIVPPAIAFGVGGAGLVLGAVTGGLTFAAKDSIASKCSPSGVCSESVRGEYDSAIALSRVSTVGFVIAGIGAGAGTALLLLPGKKDKPAQTAIQIGPSFIGVKGTF